MNLQSSTVVGDYSGTGSRRDDMPRASGHGVIGTDFIKLNARSHTVGFGLGFDLESTEASFRQYAKQQGVDPDALIADASIHFTSNVIEPRMSPLTTKELDELVEDDRRAGNIKVSNMGRKNLS